MARKGSRAKKKKNKKPAREQRPRKKETRSEPGEISPAKTTAAKEQGASGTGVSGTNVTGTVFKICRWVSSKVQGTTESSQDADKNTPEQSSSAVPEASSSSLDTDPRDAEQDDSTEHDQLSKHNESIEHDDPAAAAMGRNLDQEAAVLEDTAGHGTRRVGFVDETSETSQETATNETSTSTKDAEAGDAPLEPISSEPVDESTSSADSASSSDTVIPDLPQGWTVKSASERLSRLTDMILFEPEETNQIFGGLGGPRDGNDNRLSLKLFHVLAEAANLNGALDRGPLSAEDRRELARLVDCLEKWLEDCKVRLADLWIDMGMLYLEEHLREGVRMGFREWGNNMWEVGMFIQERTIGLRNRLIRQVGIETAGMDLTPIEEQSEPESS